MTMSILNILLVVIATFSQTTVPTLGKYRFKTLRLATFNAGLLPAVMPEVSEEQHCLVMR